MLEIHAFHIRDGGLIFSHRDNPLLAAWKDFVVFFYSSNGGRCSAPVCAGALLSFPSVLNLLVKEEMMADVTVIIELSIVKTRP
jgi:hypothetical protein